MSEKSLAGVKLVKSQEVKSPVQVGSANFPVCRICQTTSASEILISPCNCKGTLAYIHLSCLECWLNQSGRNYCELCSFRFVLHFFFGLLLLNKKNSGMTRSRLNVTDYAKVSVYGYATLEIGVTFVQTLL